MTHKLPELFKEIIRHDAAKPTGNVLSLEWVKRRRQLTASAVRFIARQRGTGGGGASG